MRGIACVIVALLLLHSALAVRFTEIMYNPPGSDNNLEFLEVEDAWNLSGWTIADASSNDTLVPLQVNESSEYSLIVEEGFWFGDLSCSVYSAGSTIGNNLNNDGDALFLFDENGTQVAATNYTGGVASNDGHSLELRNGSWTASVSLGGSPCAPNPNMDDAEDGEENDGNATKGNDTATGGNDTENSTANISLAVLLPATTYLGIAYTSLFRVQNEAYVSGASTPVNVTVAYDVTRDNATILEGNVTKTINKYSSAKTGRIVLDEEGNYTLCGRIIAVDGREQENGTEVCAAFGAVNPATIPCNVTLGLELFDGKRVYDAGERVKFRHIVTEESADGTVFPYVIRYTVEDLLTGKTTVKITENTNQKTFTPHIDGIGAFLIKSALVAVTCNNTATATEDERLVVVRDDSAKKNASRVEIKDVTPSSGGAKVTLSLYRGDTRKYSVKVWLEDARGRKASNIVSLSLLQDFQEYNSAVTLPLKPGAKGGRYTAVVEGLTSATAYASRSKGTSGPPPTLRMRRRRASRRSILGAGRQPRQSSSTRCSRARVRRWPS